MAKRGEWHEAARIIRAAHPDWSYERIGRFLGVTDAAVWKVLNPERTRELNRRSEARPERKAAKAAWDKAHRESHYDECECGARKARNSTRCLGCRRLVEDARRALAEGMWADGWTQREIREVLPSFHLGAARQGGWKLPHRRTPEQAARITAGTREAMGLAA
jgi:hypothetical protein